MSAWRVPAAVGAALAVLVIAIVVLQAGPADADPADRLARELRCPDCQGLSVADSPTASAAEIRRQIDELLAAGESPDAVRAHFVARYGEWILLAPSSLLPWLIPVAITAVGAVLMLLWIIRRPAAPALATDPPPDVRRRLREEAEALDA